MLGLLLSLRKLPIAMADLLIHDKCFETMPLLGHLSLCVEFSQWINIVISLS